ncbi:hypothetical protein HMPREF3034_01978 [Prevotella sp. DNF00663]|nr:hypothetical protein HMPREF3034_01978 [Prevotella sp. DNF00663]
MCDGRFAILILSMFYIITCRFINLLTQIAAVAWQSCCFGSAVMLNGLCSDAEETLQQMKSEELGVTSEEL